MGPKAPVPTARLAPVSGPAGYDTKVTAIGWKPVEARGGDIDADGLPRMIYDDTAKNAEAFEKITDAFAAKGWLPWICINIPGVNAQYLVWIRTKE